MQTPQIKSLRELELQNWRNNFTSHLETKEDKEEALQIWLEVIKRTLFYFPLPSCKKDPCSRDILIVDKNRPFLTTRGGGGVERTKGREEQSNNTPSPNKVKTEEVLETSLYALSQWQDCRQLNSKFLANALLRGLLIGVEEEGGPWLNIHRR